MSKHTIIQMKMKLCELEITMWSNQAQWSIKTGNDKAFGEAQDIISRQINQYQKYYNEYLRLPVGGKA